jgi:hypothetical protein
MDIKYTEKLENSGVGEYSAVNDFSNRDNASASF